MNDKRFNSFLIIGILVTACLLALQQFLPKKRLLLIPNAKTEYYFHAGTLPDGSSAAQWIDEKNVHWRCRFPTPDGSYFPCSLGLLFYSTEPTNGLDLSGYSHLNIKLSHKGDANKIRLSLRNFNPAYAKVEDGNSTKFMSVNLATRDLGQEIRISLNDFKVADWWLEQLNIPRQLANPEYNKIKTLGIDYTEALASGDYEISIEKLEFEGEWISAEHWYLGILVMWLLGIFSYAVLQLVQLRAQSKHDVQVINNLNQDNTELRRETDKFRRLSTVDPLTQTYNRFGIDQIINTLVALKESESEAPNSPDFSLILIDIDHFKRINDRRGHDTGDRILQAVAQIVGKAISRKDYLGRWGGEEFIVILPNKPKAFAIAMAEKIRLTIQDKVFETENPVLVTASFGVSDRLPGEDFNETFKRADIALYQAKAQGRNCSVLAEDSLAS